MNNQIYYLFILLSIANNLRVITSFVIDNWKFGDEIRNLGKNLEFNNDLGLIPG